MFYRANAALRRAKTTESRIVRVRALADNDRLWMTVIGVSRDPLNALPAEIRAKLVSVGLAVQREMQREAPDIDFLLAINENVAAGLSGQP